MVVSMKPNTLNDKVCLVIPFHNEAKSVAPLITEWIQTLKFHKIDFSILALNSGSTDDTRGVLRTLSEEHSNLQIRDIEDKGHGNAIITGYRDAIQSKCEWIFHCDSDGQIRPLEFLKFWENRNQFETQIGYRAHRVDGFFQSTFSRVKSKFISKLFGTYILDINIPYRLIKKDLISVIIDEIPSIHLVPNIFINLLASKTSKGFQQYPVVHRKRRFEHTLGEKHLHFIQGIYSFLEILSFRIIYSSRVKDIIRVRRRHEDRKKNAISK